MIQKRVAGRKYRTSAGFTIVEMMIALSVLAVILLVTAAVITRFNVTNRQALTQTTTLTTARAIQAQVSEWLQFNRPNSANLTLPVPGGGSDSGAYCIGDVRLSYRIGQQYTGQNTTHALISDSTNGTGCGGAGVNLNATISGAREYLAPNMRLAKLDIVPISAATQLYSVTVKVVYGDTDLLDNPTGANASCKPGRGSEFCAVSELTTTVQSRL